jgi:hypothetical protein
MSYDHEEQMRANLAHRENPEVGDYWSECLIPICVVLFVSKNHITLCKKRKDVGPKHWTWDLEHIQTLSLDEFRQWISYRLDGQTWCDVSSKKQWWAVEEAGFPVPPEVKKKY